MRNKTLLRTWIKGSHSIGSPNALRRIALAREDALDHAERLARGVEARIAPERQQQNQRLVCLQGNRDLAEAPLSYHGNLRCA